MEISLRPHHLLCLQGYKGQNYNRIQKYNWNTIINILKTKPETDILIISGEDDLCSHCLSKVSALKSSYCKEGNVKKIDNQVAKILGLTIGQTIKYNEILDRLKKIMTPDNHQKLCSTCCWWQKGLCRDSFK